MAEITTRGQDTFRSIVDRANNLKEKIDSNDWKETNKYLEKYKKDLATFKSKIDKEEDKLRINTSSHTKMYSNPRQPYQGFNSSMMQNNQERLKQNAEFDAMFNNLGRSNSSMTSNNPRQSYQGFNSSMMQNNQERLKQNAEFGAMFNNLGRSNSSMTSNNPRQPYQGFNSSMMQGNQGNLFNSISNKTKSNNSLGSITLNDNNSSFKDRKITDNSNSNVKM